MSQGWLRTPLRVLWRSPLGVCYSGLAVAGDRLYGMDSASGDEFVFARRTDDTVPSTVKPARASPRATAALAAGRSFDLQSRQGEVR